MTRDRITIADASKVSGAEFLRALCGDPNDISHCDQAGGYFYRDGGWWKIREHHTGVQITEPVKGDPLLKHDRRKVA